MYVFDVRNMSSINVLHTKNLFKYIFDMCLETWVGGRGEREGEEEQNSVLLA